ncbi:membrane protein [Streptomyces roseochromogenus subsp. oscitans DS 12.976]|uniref:Membrane protein n=1 Tax=Streptomyces roseochromogenus subsp. oscitans DS 12.976 TaxID=1352936 RepID=V6KUY6_STRRC|nr:membrane protein [Streptomyces roseochromogenus subsp. oscitans DS 12.976]
MADTGTGAPARVRWNKVPEVTVYFWVIKVLCTTVGETAADLLNEKAGLGLTGVSLLMSALLAVVLVVQFRTRAYRAGVYWLAVALISVVGTLVSDNLTDNMGVALETTTTVFAIALVTVFALWYRTERTLSIHHIDTTRREAFYWLAVLCTFALGTSAGDLLAEKMDLGYWLSALLFAAAIAAVALARFTLGLSAVTSFWIAYVLTRPLGASVGDYLSQPTGDGGLGLGTVVTSALFLTVILALVVYLIVTRKDVTEQQAVRQTGAPAHRA